MARLKKLPPAINASITTSGRRYGPIIGPSPPRVYWTHEHGGRLLRKVRDNQRGVYIVTEYDAKGRKKSVTVQRIEGRFNAFWPELQAEEAHRTIRGMGRKVRRSELKPRKK